jgi:hypothetical protein
MKPNESISQVELDFHDGSMRTCFQAIVNLRILNEQTDRANLTNYDIQLQNGHMTEDLYADLTALIYARRPDWANSGNDAC